VVEKTEKSLSLKVSAVSDYARYEIQSRKIIFLPTMMYTSRVFKFNVKNTSTIKINYSCKIVSAQTGKTDPGFFFVAPHTGTISPNCDEAFTVKFSPT
jgi:hydrocephalus-inducing protein